MIGQHGQEHTIDWQTGVYQLQHPSACLRENSNLSNIMIYPLLILSLSENVHIIQLDQGCINSSKLNERIRRAFMFLVRAADRTYNKTEVYYSLPLQMVEKCQAWSYKFCLSNLSLHAIRAYLSKFRTGRELNLNGKNKRSFDCIKKLIIRNFCRKKKKRIRTDQLK